MSNTWIGIIWWATWFFYLVGGTRTPFTGLEFIATALLAPFMGPAIFFIKLTQRRK